MTGDANIPQEVEGKNLSFVLRGAKGTEPQAAFLQGMGHTFKWKDGYEWRAVRDKRFTYAKYLRDGKELLFDRKKDPYMRNELARDSSYAHELERLRALMAERMRYLKDGFHKCSWYRDNWMYKNYSVKSGAKGQFGPLAPVEPERK
jgi:arylsulfatase A-like enzyme